MSIRGMIDAAGEGNAAELEKNFNEVVSEKLGARLSEIRTQVVSDMFGLQEEVLELSEEMIVEYLETLSEEDLEYIESLSEEEAYSLIESDIRRYTKMGAKVGTVQGAAGGAVAGGVRKGVRKVANLGRRIVGKKPTKSPKHY